MVASSSSTIVLADLAHLVLLALTAQLALGCLLHAATAFLLRRAARGRGGRPRRRWILACEATRGLATALVPTLAFAVAGVALTAGRSVLGATWAVWIPAWTATLSTSGCFVLLHAVSLERRGRLRAARRVAWLGGTTTLVGALALLIAVFTELLFNAPLRRTVLLRSDAGIAAVALGMIGVGLGAFIAATGGLARKPRPSAFFALTLYLAGLAALLGALQAADPGCCVQRIHRTLLRARTAGRLAGAPRIGTPTPRVATRSESS